MHTRTVRRGDLQCLLEESETELGCRLRNVADKGVREVDLLVRLQFVLPVLDVKRALLQIRVVEEAMSRG